ncbi:MAG TPA: DUF6326 family protein [Thermoplasmata archaeon]
MKMNVKVLLAGLWISVMFLYIYVDHFSLFREDVIEDLSAGKIGGFDITQTYLLSVTVLMAIPSLMIFMSLYLKAKMNRYANIMVGSLYALVTVGGLAGETWAYYIFGSILELVLVGSIIYLAWKWPAAEETSTSGG